MELRLQTSGRGPGCYIYGAPSPDLEQLCPLAGLAQPGGEYPQSAGRRVRVKACRPMPGIDVDVRSDILRNRV